MTSKWAIVAVANKNDCVIVDFDTFEEATKWANMHFTDNVNWIVTSVRKKEEYMLLLSEVMP